MSNINGNYNQFETSAESTENTDVAEGGIIGAIGGGIVGALAGGPIGAIIGAVVGGSASAIAIDAVDHHDRDIAAETEPVPDYSISPHQYFDAAGLAGEPAGSVFDGSLEPAITEFIVQEVPLLGGEDIIDLEAATRLRAYQLWEVRGHRDGFADQDWYDAEYELVSASLAENIRQSGEPLIVEEVVLYEA